MPKVGKKKFPYTASGRRMAAKERKNMEKKNRR